MKPPPKSSGRTGKKKSKKIKEKTKGKGRKGKSVMPVGRKKKIEKRT